MADYFLVFMVSVITAVGVVLLAAAIYLIDKNAARRDEPRA